MITMAGAKVVAAILVLLVLIIIAAIAYLPKTSTSLTNAFIVQLTDPPQVPNGTQALTLYYSSISLHESGNANSTGFVNVAQSGSINLMELINLTQTLAVTTKIPNNYFDMVRFNITKATITISNNTYNVTVPSNRLLVKISNSSAAAGGALVEINPSIIEVYSGNQTIFLMVPSAKAVVVGGALVNSSSAKVGFKAKVSESARAQLQHGIANISITSASLSQVGNNTSVSVTVKDNSNTSVSLKHVMIYGYMQLLGPGNVIRPMNESTQVPYSNHDASLEGIQAGSNSIASAGDSGIGSIDGASIANITAVVSTILNSSSSAGINASSVSRIIKNVGITSFNGITSFIIQRHYNHKQLRYGQRDGLSQKRISRQHRERGCRHWHKRKCNNGRNAA
jgi:uncharacterized protein YxeA